MIDPSYSTRLPKSSQQSWLQGWRRPRGIDWASTDHAVLPSSTLTAYQVESVSLSRTLLLGSVLECRCRLWLSRGWWKWRSSSPDVLVVGRSARGRARGGRDCPESAEEPAQPVRVSRATRTMCFDAYVLADALRTDRARLRPLVPDSRRRSRCARLPGAKGPRQQPGRMWPTSYAHTADQVARCVGLFAELDSPVSLAFLTRFASQDNAAGSPPGAWPTGRAAGRLQRPGRPRRAARPPGQRTARYHRSPRRRRGRITRALVAVLSSLNDQIKALDGPDRRAARPACRPPIFTSLPRSGPSAPPACSPRSATAARASRPPESLACLAGVGPSTRQSGKIRGSGSGGPATSSSVTPSPTSPATPARPAPGPPSSTTRPSPAATTTRTPSASSPAPGCTSSGTAGRTESPTTQPATRPSNASSTRRVRRRASQLRPLPAADGTRRSHRQGRT